MIISGNTANLVHHSKAAETLLGDLEASVIHLEVNKISSRGSNNRILVGRNSRKNGSNINIREGRMGRSTIHSREEVRKILRSLLKKHRKRLRKGFSRISGEDLQETMIIKGNSKNNRGEERKRNREDRKSLTETNKSINKRKKIVFKITTKSSKERK